MSGLGANETIQVDGVVVSVNEESNYAYLNVAGLGRVLLSPLMHGDDVKVADWFSATITQYRDAAPIHEKNLCRYAIRGRVKAIKEKVSTGSRIDRNGVEVVRIQTPIMIGTIRDDNTIAISEHVGRIFIEKKFRSQFQLKPKMVLDASVQSCEPSDKNAFCFWTVKALATNDDPEVELGIRECLGHFSGFIEKNLCLIELFGENEGFVCVRPLDFAHAIPPKKLKEAEIIVVYTNQSLSPLRNFPVGVCYAYVPEGDELDLMKERVTASTNRGQRSDFSHNGAVRGIDESRPFEKESEESVESKCIHSDLIGRLMNVDEVKSQLKRDDPKLYERVVKFLEANNVVQ